jgi:peptide/nickel transport system permease protein
MVLAITGTAITAPLVAPHDPFQQSLSRRLLPPLSALPHAGRALLGTDQLGRDVLSRVIFASRISLVVGAFSVTCAGLLGASWGMASGYYGGLLDSLMMRTADLQLSFPLILLALTIISVLGSGLVNLIVVFAITGWPLYARTIRGSALSIRSADFIDAARAVGSSDARILFRHILPNVVAPLIVIASYDMARIIILEAALGFLGLGIQPPTPTWGNMLADGREYIRDAWWLSTFPGVMIMLTAAGINFVGDALREIFDPRLARE